MGEGLEDGGQRRDFVHVHDVVDANVKALTTGFSGGVNICTGVETDVNRIYALLAKCAGVSRPPLYAAARLGEQRRSVLANAKARDVLGWSPRLDIEHGIANTIEWYRSSAS